MTEIQTPPVRMDKRETVISFSRPCPNCFHAQMSPSRYRPWERFLRLGLFRPFRCRECEHRFWRPLWWRPEKG